MEKIKKIKIRQQIHYSCLIFKYKNKAPIGEDLGLCTLCFYNADILHYYLVLKSNKRISKTIA